MTACSELWVTLGRNNETAHPIIEDPGIETCVVCFGQELAGCVLDVMQGASAGCIVPGHGKLVMCKSIVPITEFLLLPGPVSNRHG
jgi:hypothetical protein